MDSNPYINHTVEQRIRLYQQLIQERGALANKYARVCTKLIDCTSKLEDLKESYDKLAISLGSHKLEENGVISRKTSGFFHSNTEPTSQVVKEFLHQVAAIEAAYCETEDYQQRLSEEKAALEVSSEFNKTKINYLEALQ